MFRDMFCVNVYLKCFNYPTQNPDEFGVCPRGVGAQGKDKVLNLHTAQSCTHLHIVHTQRTIQRCNSTQEGGRNGIPNLAVQGANHSGIMLHIRVSIWISFVIARNQPYMTFELQMRG